MKRMIFAVVLMLLPAGVAQAGVFEYKAFSWANYGSPFVYRATTADDLASALNGGAFLFSDGTATLDDLFQNGQTSFSQEYDVGGGLHVAFAAESFYHPAEPLSTAAPGIGAKASASNNQYIGNATIIGESYVYLKHTVSISNPTTRDDFLKSFGFTTSLDGVIEAYDDAIVLVGQAIRLTLDDGRSYTASDVQPYIGINGPFHPHFFGRPGLWSDPAITLTNSGPYGTELIAHGAHSMTIETLFYLRAQTGVGIMQHGAGRASADFSNTMRVSNIQFFDENDQVIPGLQVVGANGDVYPYNAVPEPTTLALFGAGSIGLLLARFRRAQRS